MAELYTTPNTTASTTNPTENQPISTESRLGEADGIAGETED
jgi:hypothetical protein